MPKNKTASSVKTDIGGDGKHLAPKKSSEDHPLKNFMRRSADTKAEKWANYLARRQKRIKEEKQQIRDNISNLTIEELTELYVDAICK